MLRLVEKLNFPDKETKVFLMSYSDDCYRIGKTLSSQYDYEALKADSHKLHLTCAAVAEVCGA